MSSDTIAMIIGGVIGLLAGSIGLAFWLALVDKRNRGEDYSK